MFLYCSVCVCVCISEVSRTAEIAEALQNRLDAYKAEKRELGSVSVRLMWELTVRLSLFN